MKQLDKKQLDKSGLSIIIHLREDNLLENLLEALSGGVVDRWIEVIVIDPVRKEKINRAARKCSMNVFVRHIRVSNILPLPDGYARNKARFPEVMQVSSTGDLKRLIKRLSTNNKNSRLTGDKCPFVMDAKPPSPVLPIEDALFLCEEYEDKGLHEVPDTFALVRIIGNDLYPYHDKGQSEANLKFILENEPNLESCEKHWIINRIFDRDEETKVMALLERYQQHYTRLPFQIAEYQNCQWDIASFPDKKIVFSQKYEMPKKVKKYIKAQLYRCKNNYAINYNGARNLALTIARRKAKWLLPWDGNSFFTRESWQKITKTIKDAPYYKYFLVPMAGMTLSQCLVDDEWASDANEPPQVIFRCDAKEKFDERYLYGRRSKVELLWRLGVPGTWQDAPNFHWDLPYPDHSNEAGHYRWAGKAFCLGLDRSRKQPRIEVVTGMLEKLDCQILDRHFTNKPFLQYALASGLPVNQSFHKDYLSSIMGVIAENADKALERGPFSIVHKTTLPPSNDPHDYWHPAPYWWPNPETSDGLPYVHRDGKRVPGTEMYSQESEKYDRTSLQRLFDDTTSLALAWWFTRNERYIEHAARLIRTWFVDPETRMNPHLRYAQVRRGHCGNEGQSTGIIELKDFYYFLDAIRMAEKAGYLDETDCRKFREWLGSYLEWLTTSSQGKKECSAQNNHGLLYDLQVASISAFLDAREAFLNCMRRAHARLSKHVADDGSQPYELDRSITAHYCAFNLQQWINLARIAERSGEDLWQADHEKNGTPAIRRAMAWLMRYVEGNQWPYRQIKPFDTARWLPIAYTYIEKYDGVVVSPLIAPLDAAKAVYHPHDGIPPYWQLTMKECWSTEHDKMDC